MDIVASHWIYFAGILLIILTMLLRRNVVVPAIVMTFIIGLVFTGSVTMGLQTIFTASLVAAGELFSIFLIIAIMTALLQGLEVVGANEQMIKPFGKIMTNGHISYYVIIIVTYCISLFFWPTPAVPLVGALLLPVAIRAGLPPIAGAAAIAIAGQGMALSSDYIIQIAPMLSATAAGVDIQAVADRAFVLSIITGVVAIGVAYLMLRKSIQKPSATHLNKWMGEKRIEHRESIGWKGKLFAIVVPVTFLIVILYMLYTTFFTDISLEGGSGAALIGGAALILLILASVFYKPKQVFDNVSDCMVDGFLFAFKAMGPVIPIAGFFFLGSDEFSGSILQTETAPAFLFDLVQSGQQFIPEHGIFAAFGILLIGMITGLDGSGFSGLPLTGALSGALGTVTGVDAATLAAIGQMGAIWVGGGTLIAWSSLVAVAGVARVDVQTLVRVCFFPVILGLLLSTLYAVFFYVNEVRREDHRSSLVYG
ncbi:membrane protein [Geomicrobium sp. JCM 19055]|uniref:membrane protein n=1 Tax=Geomicrobium sp. JCM 19055 TaxID=1460649 RepID=UPI00045ED501|nr:membrane protein [Geomicrobium sp. JCM 19055]GAJ98454.1 putative membrane protein [Geomicrobium sp. JCM 19055]